MADQNQSNKKGMNTLADDIDRSPLLTELERIGATVSRKGIQRIQLEDKMEKEETLLKQLLEQGQVTPQFVSSPFYQEQTQGLRENIKGLKTKINTLDTAARSRAETEASNYITRQFGSTAINAQAAAIQKEASTQNSAFSMFGKSFDELETRRQDILASIRARERTVQNEIKGTFTGRGQVDPEKSAAIGVIAGGLQGELKELATINAAQAFQRVAGIDPTSKAKYLAATSAQINKIISAEAIAQEVKAGGVQIAGQSDPVAMKDINKEMLNQAKLLNDALKKLAETSADATEDLEKFRKQADEAAGNFEKLEKAQAASGGPGWGKTVTTLNNISQGFGIAGQAAQSLMIDQRMGQLSNTMGFANLANNRYNTYRQARAGDVASQYSLLDEGDTENFSTEMRKASNIVNGVYGVGSVAQTAAGGVQTAATLNPVENLISTSEVQNVRQQGLLQVGAGIAGTAIRIGDTARQVTANQNQIAAQNLGLEAKKALRYVSTEQAQGLRNYHVGLGVAGMGMGENAPNFIQEAGSDAMLDKLIQARLSPEQFIEMAQVGVAGMGSAFKSSDIVTSRNLERAGFGSMANNMQRMATLTSAGSNNPQENLANILEVAVGNGINSSRALDLIVQNTAATADGVAQASGLDTTSSGAALIAGTVNRDLAAKNDIFATERASTVQQALSKLANDTSVSYSGMLNTANISNKTGLSTVDAAFAGDIDIATLKAMRDSKDADKQLLNIGVDWQKSKMQSPQQLIDSLIDSKLSAAMVGSGALELDTTGGKMSNAIADKIRKGEPLNREEQQLAGKLGMAGAKGIGGEEFSSGLKSWFSEPNKSDKIDKAIKGETPASAQTIADDLRTSGFKQASEAAKQAATELGGFTKAIQTFVALQSTFEKSGQKNEAEYSVMGERMAKDFSASTKMFSDGAKIFRDAVLKFSDLPGIKSNAQPLTPEAITDLQKRIGNK